ncbi:MAG TPA: hypothetical protein V6C76_15740 [Drouetiella sp.]
MEKLFTPNKWFVGFCGILIVVFLSLQYVSRARLLDLAQAWAAEIYTYDWPGANLHSSAKMTKADLVKKTESDAVIKVSGKQSLDVTGAAPKHSETECGAQLTFYKHNNEWVLGKVELQ